VAGKWGEDYWDGDRKYGYGGYSYDGRWLSVATDMTEHYNLKSDDHVLDVGCGKGHLLYEFTQAVPGISVSGLDISEYGITHAKKEIQSNLQLGNCIELPYPDDSFDFVFSLNTFHNLKIFELKAALKEIQRVSRGRSYLCVESYRNESEKVNLLYWQLTCNSFYSVEEWQWLAADCGYTGDLGFIFFE
jgi:ubiquinone/menaquinone biosynthesis C-methylase UbiE